MAQLITEAEFEEKVLKADKPVLVDFYADWCGPCMAMAPVIDDLAQDMDGQAYVYKMNVDESTRITTQLGIMSIPCFYAFKNGEAFDMRMGTQPMESLKSMLA